MAADMFTISQVEFQAIPNAKVLYVSLRLWLLPLAYVETLVFNIPISTLPEDDNYCLMA